MFEKRSEPAGKGRFGDLPAMLRIALQVGKPEVKICLDE
jgi:hypothetical protein